ncbi:MAG: hypothetical protein MJZ51_05845 [Bacteroidales bacterium]|nr:hypothetical protein [Bacteroidales bacterium]
MSGLKQDIRFLEYDSNGSKVAVNSLFDVQTGDRKEFVANSHAEKVVCQLQWEYYGTSKTFYIANVFFIEKGKTITIDLNDHTLTSNSNPIK